MAIAEILMPQMGESVMEGTVIKWLVKPGDQVEEEDSVIEIATDKVDTEIPCPFGGKITELLCKEGDVVQVGAPIALIETSSTQAENTASAPEPELQGAKPETNPEALAPKVAEPLDSSAVSSLLMSSPIKGRFYSPLVLNIAREESINQDTLELLVGSGKDGRVTKKDILLYVTNKSGLSATELKETLKEEPVHPGAPSTSLEVIPETKPDKSVSSVFMDNQTVKFTGDYEVVEMTRTRKIISERMLNSKKTSAHVTSIVEADVSNVVYWRNRWKNHFKEKESTILTFTPIFIEAVAKAIKDYPKINASVDGQTIIYKKNINIGLAVALPDGNLVVPVIKNADQLNLVGLTKQVNELAKKARKGKLSPADLDGGTYTVSNVGSFGNLIGTPILVQPQVGILALGAIVKKPAVVETPCGDTIGIRHQMFLSHSYDHRIVDGSLGGMFVRRVADYLEQFDLERKVL